MSDNVLLMEEENGVATLTLNRPEVMNSEHTGCDHYCGR
jgi:enoyl-CoA hydratase/carnithine racemase